jgi:hypothetical protein
MTLKVDMGLPKNPFIWDYSLPDFLNEHGKRKFQWNYQNPNRIFELKYINDFVLHYFFGNNYDGPRIYFLDSQWGDTERFYIKDKLVL